MTSVPLRARLMAVLRPKPRLPPVIRAILLVGFISILSCYWLHFAANAFTFIWQGISSSTSQFLQYLKLCRRPQPPHPCRATPARVRLRVLARPDRVLISPHADIAFHLG